MHRLRTKRLQAIVLIDDATFIVTDTETTGCRAGDHCVIEIGAVRVTGGRIAGEFAELINPGVPIPRFITSLTGITDRMVAGAAPASTVVPRFGAFLGDGVLVAHNLTFDRNFLNWERRRLGLGDLPNQTLCTLRLARRLLPALPSKGLQRVAAHYGLRVDGRHRALGDARATALILLRLIEILKHEHQVRTLAELLGFQYARYARIRAEASHFIRIRSEIIPSMPEHPGVYLMKDARGRVIYVGKARSLRSRVRSYFAASEGHSGAHIRQLVKAVRDVEWRVLPSEVHALILESRLIKQMQPRFNRMLRTAQAYPFLRVSHGAAGTLGLAFELDPQKGEFYGPFNSVAEGDRFALILGRLFDLPVSELAPQRRVQTDPHRRAASPLPFPVFAGGTVPERIAACRELLEGKDAGAVAHLQEAMGEASRRAEYEDAAICRDAASLVQNYLNRGPAVQGNVCNRHQIIFVRDAAEPYLVTLAAGRVLYWCAAGSSTAAEFLQCVKDRLAEGDGPRARSTLDGFDPVDEIRIVAQWLYRGRDRISSVPFDPNHLDDRLAARIEPFVSTQPASASDA